MMTEEPATRSRLKQFGFIGNLLPYSSNPVQIVYLSRLFATWLNTFHRQCPGGLPKSPGRQTDQCLINTASSTGRCNTIRCVDSTMLPREKRSVWLYSVKT